MIRLAASSFIIHKEAESLEDCQDACAQNNEKRRYAIADGVTHSFFPKEWAALLVEHFCDNTDLSVARTDWRAWIAPIQQKWYEQIKEKVCERNLFYLTNPFNSQESAASTFIGIEFSKDSGAWEAVIVGDSCLFHQSDSGFKSYPIENSADFTNRPEFFASFAKDNHSEPKFRHGKANPGDTFILATDALAKWILEHKEVGKLDTALDRLKAVKTDEQFCQFVHEARHDEAIRFVNDDVTLMLISVEDNQGPKETKLEVPLQTQTQEPTKQQQDLLSSVLFWGIFAGVFMFFAGFTMLLLRLL